MNLTLEQKISLARLAGVDFKDNTDFLGTIWDRDGNSGVINWNDIQLIKEGIRSKGYLFNSGNFPDHYFCNINNVERDGFDINNIYNIIIEKSVESESAAILTAALKLCEHLKI